MAGQKIEFYGSHGEVKRTSAIFYYKVGGGHSTTLSLMNYWKVKRDIAVSLSATVRTMDGDSVLREDLHFNNGQVINYRPSLNFDNDSEVFEGSIEIEGLADVNLVIPYAAIMAIYSAPDSISLTHSYARSYLQEEIDNGTAITTGNEACWTLRDSDKVKSFCVFHNGAEQQEEQTVVLELINCRGEVKIHQWLMPALSPFQTVKIVPQERVDDLPLFLQGEEGSGRISFCLNRGFTRMLVGNISANQREMQTAHSNFDYSKKEQDIVSHQDATATMLLPDFKLGKQSVFLYPDYAPGDYTITTVNSSLELKARNTGRRLIKLDSDNDELQIERADGMLPNRFVTGFVAQFDSHRLPVEVSRGIRHRGEPPKRFWWGPCISSSKLKSKLVLNPYVKYGEGDPSAAASFNLFSSLGHEILKKDYEAFPVEAFSQGVEVEEIFGPKINNFLADDFGYFTFYSSYTMFDCVVIVQRNDGAVGMEHCF